jgi:hypothetical protein
MVLFHTDDYVPDFLFSERPATVSAILPESSPVV